MPEPATTIRYDRNLIDTLLRDHAELGRLFSRIGKAGKAGDVGEARSLLISFKARLKAHIVVENARFYDYLEQASAGDPRTLRLLRGYRREMAQIARNLFAFVRQYHGSQFLAEELAQFNDDHAVVGKQLEHRLDAEEDNLYRLYRQP
ncbi:MAG TPA: hemerythrin domain-containing protein [Rhodanobacteraceae bacterium]|nr:hemerythrin domain-containing protein [Rhodanobacteraceae bacterium]